jgi:hypothetical protein
MVELLTLDLAEMSATEDPRLAIERRDTERAVMLWRKKASAFGCPPPLAEFDFSRIRGDWGYRFIISGDDVECSVFLVYGLQFARLLRLREKAICYKPMVEQIPERYQPLFIEGSRDAINDAAPARCGGAVLHEGKVELYRAAFMPVRLNPTSSHALIFGSFNYRIVPGLVLDRDGVL